MGDRTTPIGRERAFALNSYAQSLASGRCDEATTARLATELLDNAVALTAELLRLHEQAERLSDAWQDRWDEELSANRHSGARAYEQARADLDALIGGTLPDAVLVNRRLAVFADEPIPAWVTE